MNIKQKLKRGIKSIIMLTKEEKKIPIPLQTNTTELLKGKTALITGGTGGIGMAIAESFLKNGAQVILAGTTEAKLKTSIEKLEKGLDCASRLRSIVINVKDVNSLPDKIRFASALFETNKIDILVNAAGILNHSDFWNTTEKEYDAVMDINLKGTFFICQAMAAYMKENKIQGHILNVSSSSALRPAWTPYPISKWAIRGFTLGLADTLLPYGITVNAIAPGPVATAMLGKKAGDSIHNQNNPIGRYAEPSEIANLATFMVSDMGNMIVGDTFYITGGAGTIRSSL